jgi:pimeloyl-ACP methyl ester carboxylesterase
VVLVHGAWHGAWCWSRVVGGLADAAQRAIAVDLPGHGDDAGPLLDLHGDAERVRAVVDGIGGPVVLAGHSYGGAVITEAGAHPAVEHLVYVCAFAVDERDTLGAALSDDPEAQAIDHSGRPDPGAALVFADDGSCRVRDAEAATALFYADCDPADAAWAWARLGAQPIASLQQSPSAVAWRDTPSTYAVCTEDLAIHPDLQRLMARRCTNAVEWPTGHSPFLNRPDLVVELLASLATG